jgi:3-hydroxyisobutyrate dehydrogenase-like beta-hydroxyacid dehydrogenase
MTIRVGFIGLGDIGAAMARRILEGGFQVTSSANRRREAIDELKAHGLIEAKNPQDVAAQSDILITMVVDEAQTDTVLKAEDGALQAMSPGSTIVVMSTVSPGYCQTLSSTAEAGGIAVLDCPVAGARPRAEKGTLALICGGKSDDIERCRPILETMGTIHHCGAVGMGQVVKLANNALVAAKYKAVEEVRKMADAYGMNLGDLMGVLEHSTGKSFVVDNWEFLSSNWEHMGRMAKKDLDLFLDAAREQNVETKLMNTVEKLDWPKREQ